jgi:signal transduction histidine kinase
MPSNWYSLAAIATIAGIFAIDMNTPLGIGVPFLYLLVVLFSIAARASNAALLSIASICTALTVIKLLVPQVAGVVAFGQSNRAIFVVLVWTLLGFEFVRRSEAMRQANAGLQSEIAERRRAEQTINDYASRLQGLTSQLVEAQEIERKKLAEALHDRIGPNLSTLNISLNLALTQLPVEAAAIVKPRIDDSLALVEQTTELVRGVMEELHPVLLDQYGLDVALRWYGDEFARRTGLAFAYEATELFPRLRVRTETTLFRVAQEALTNVAKHAAARQASVSLRRAAAGIELKIADDGVGITAPGDGNPVIGSGWGLTMVKERVRSIGAALQIETSDKGTTISVEVPNGAWEIEA